MVEIFTSSHVSVRRSALRETGLASARVRGCPFVHFVCILTVILQRVRVTLSSVITFLDYFGNPKLDLWAAG